MIGQESKNRVFERSALKFTASLILLLTLVGYPLVAPISLIFGLDSLSVSIPFRVFIVILSLIVITEGFFLRYKFPFGIFWIFWWTFWGLYISRIAIDGFFNPEALRLSVIEYYAYALGFSMIPAFAMSSNLDDSVLRRTLIWVIVLGTFGILLNTWFIYSQKISVTLEEFFSARVESETFNPIILSHLGITVLILSAWMLVMGSYSKFKMILLFICLITGAMASIAGASRGALLISAVTLPIITYLGIKNLHGRKLFYFFVFAGLFISAIAWVLTKQEEIVLINRVLEILFTDEVRKTLLVDGWNLFLKNPLLGAGTEPLGFYPHNVVLESFMLSGITSGFLFVSIIMISAVAAVKIFFIDPQNSWMSLLYIQYTVGAMFSGSLGESASMWILMVLVVSHLARLRFEKSSAKEYMCVVNGPRLLPRKGNPC